MNILEQITEKQVTDWMQAKLESIRTTGLRVNCLGIDATHYHECEPRNFVALHCDGQCSSSHETVDKAIEDLRGKIGEPEKRAAAKRSEAEKLLREAAELEAGK